MSQEATKISEKPTQTKRLIDFKNDPFSIVRGLMTLMIICSLSHQIKYLTGKDQDEQVKIMLYSTVVKYQWLEFISVPTKQANSIFSVISGFLACHSLYRSSGQKNYIKRYFTFTVPRFLALYPCYLILNMLQNCHVEGGDWQDYFVQVTLFSTFSDRARNLFPLYYANMAVFLFFITPLFYEVLSRLPKPVKYVALVTIGYGFSYIYHHGMYKLLHREYDLISFYCLGMAGHSFYVDFYDYIPSHFVFQIASIAVLGLQPWVTRPPHPFAFLISGSVPILIFFLVNLKAGQ